ncbi:hypothetical protein Tco_1067416, partial [Tanacetum coccineum]
MDKSITGLEGMGVKIYGLKEPKIEDSKSEIAWENIVVYTQQKRIVAAGDVTGRVMIWKGFGDQTFAGDNGRLKKEDEKPGVIGDGDADSCTTRHWHFAEVKFLFFSSDGGYLYSGNPFYLFMPVAGKGG